MVKIKDVCVQFFLFVGVFVGTFGGLWYFNKYKKIAHCHILTPLEEEIHLWPEYKDFFYKYRNKFNIVYRNVSKFLLKQIQEKISRTEDVSILFLTFLGGNPHVLFLDHKMRELEVHNVTKWQPEAIADLIRSRGFKEEEITADHPGFKETQEYFEKMKASMSKEEYEKLLKEMEDLMGKPKEEGLKIDDSANREEVFFDPEEKKKYDEYEKNKKIAEEERQA